GRQARSVRARGRYGPYGETWDVFDRSYRSAAAWAVLAPATELDKRDYPGHQDRSVPRIPVERTPGCRVQWWTVGRHGFALEPRSEGSRSKWRNGRRASLRC